MGLLEVGLRDAQGCMTGGRAGVFVTGTDTGIGKTVISACLVRRWNASYWKPVQTGLADGDDDSEAVALLSGAGPDRIHPPRFSFAAPLSPEAASHAAAASVRLDDFHLPAGDQTIVVEGAGGVLVPLGGGATMADLMVRLGLPILLVARTTLGTINHTLLSIEALRTRGLVIWGVVMVGPDGSANAEAVTRHGGVPVLARLEYSPWLTPEAVAQAGLALPAIPPARAAFAASRDA